MTSLRMYEFSVPRIKLCDALVLIASSRLAVIQMRS